MASPTKRVLITGGAGFIGSHIAAAWARRGAEVIVLDSLRSGHRDNLEGIPHTFIQASVEDADAVARAAQGVDVIHHLAALVSVPESMDKPLETESINVAGTINVLEAARRSEVRKVVFSSTSAVYGNAERPMHSEDDLPEPASPYAIAKLAAEHYMRLYAEAFGVETVALRYFNVFGPRQDPNSPYAAAVAIFSDRALAGEPLTIFGDGEQTRDFIYVDDIVQANLLAAEKGTGVCNVSSGTRITINDLAREIITATNSKSEIKYAPPRPGDVLHSRGDITKLKGLGWQPKTTLAEGLSILLNAKSPASTGEEGKTSGLKG